MDIESCSDWQSAQASLARLTDTSDVGNSPEGLAQLHQAFAEFDDDALPLMKVFVKVACCSHVPDEIRSKAVDLANSSWSSLLGSQRMRSLGSALSFITLEIHLNALGPLALPFVETALTSAHPPPAKTPSAQMQLIALCSAGVAHASSAADRLTYVQRALDLMDSLLNAGKTLPWKNVFEACWHCMRDANIGPTARFELANRVHRLLDHMIAARRQENQDEVQPQSSAGGVTVPAARDVLGAATKNIQSCSDWQSVQAIWDGLPHDDLLDNTPPVIKLFIEVACCPHAPVDKRVKALEWALDSWCELLNPGEADGLQPREVGHALHNLVFEDHLRALGPGVLPFLEAALTWAEGAPTRMTRQSRKDLLRLCRAGVEHALSTADRSRFAEQAVELMDSIMDAENAPPPPAACWNDAIQACWNCTRDSDIDPGTKAALTTHALRLLDRMHAAGQEPDARTAALKALMVARPQEG